MDKAPMHTPPPWEDRPGTTTGRIVIAPTQPKVRVMVASCGGPNRDANARLIAAAPELLEHAELDVAELEYYINNPSAWDSFDEGMSELLRKVVTRAKAAIAKATKP